MMRISKVVMIILVGWSCAFSLFAQSFTYEGLNYNVLSEIEKTVEVAENYNFTGALVIPEYVIYDGHQYAVTTIGKQAFYKCLDLSSLDIKNVTTIADEAFYGCIGLTTIELENIKTIGYKAFQNCTALTSLDLKNVATIADEAFSGCYNLKRIKAPAKVPTISKGTFGSNFNVYVPYGSKKAYEADTQWKHYGYNLCFYDFCQNETFYQINSLSEKTATYLATFNSVPENMVIPESIEYKGRTFKINRIEDWAFYNCKRLTSIELNNVTTIGDWAFAYCSALHSIDLKNVTMIGNYTFTCCTNLSSIDLKNVTTFGIYAVSNCIGLFSIDLNNVKTIEKNAFFGCSNLRKVYVPAKVPYQQCSFPSQTPILIPNGNMSSYLSDNSDWKEYTLIEYDFTEATMDYKIISEHEATAALVGPVIHVPSGHFTMPQVSHDGKHYDITEIGTVVFKNNKDLTAFDSNKVKVIRKSAFEGCSSLSYLKLRNIETIEAEAFKACAHLKAVTVYSTVPPVVQAESAFERAAYLDATLYVMTGYKKAYEEAAYWKNFLIEESDDLTGITAVVGNTFGASSIYDLNGRLVKTSAINTYGLHPGIYIVNGKKVMVK